ncbi:MAG: hypothetical protein U5M50_00835 [Sphingobium sp.]|nr:hypothetical protein [Sphingobium sp.]
MRRYPEFLPWVQARCGSRVDSETEMAADMIVGFKSVRGTLHLARVTSNVRDHVHVDYIDWSVQAFAQ